MLDFLKSNNAVIVIRLCYKAGNCQFHPVAMTSAGVKARDKRHFHASQKKEPLHKSIQKEASLKNQRNFISAPTGTRI